MNATDLTLFHWLSAGYTPTGFLLNAGILWASWGAWAALAVVVYAVHAQASQRLYVLAAVVAAAFAGMLAHRIAAELGFPRPFMAGLSPAYLPHGSRGSMPSAHASVIFTLAFIFALRPALRLPAILMAAVAVLTSWGRIYAGVHFPFDVLAGAGLAAAASMSFIVVKKLMNIYFPVRASARAIKR